MKSLPIIVGFAVGGIIGGGLGLGFPETRHMPEAVGILAVVGIIAGGLLGFAYSVVRTNPQGPTTPDGKQNLSTNDHFGGGVGIGIIMIVIALIWLFAGLAVDRIYFYPFVLLLLGIGSLIRGVINKI